MTSNARYRGRTAVSSRLKAGFRAFLGLAGFAFCIANLRNGLLTGGLPVPIRHIHATISFHTNPLGFAVLLLLWVAFTLLTAGIAFVFAVQMLQRD